MPGFGSFLSIIIINCCYSDITWVCLFFSSDSMAVTTIGTQTDGSVVRNNREGYNNLSTYLTTMLIIISVAVETHSWLPWIQDKIQYQRQTISKIHDNGRLDTSTLVEFKKFDQNDDGVIDMDEFQKMIHIVIDPKVCINVSLFLIHFLFG